MKTVLFVCTGNICRSPMAEGLFRNSMRGRKDYRVLSAGVGAVNGQVPSRYSILALQELGIDISNQRSRMLTADLVREADYIFGMTRGHVEAISLMFPQAAEKTFLLREFDDTLDSFEKDIPDPIGGSYEVYLDSRDQIEQGIASLVQYLDQLNLLKPAHERSPDVTTFAVGSDHANCRARRLLVGGQAQLDLPGR